jgi:hypothetical protein
VRNVRLFCKDSYAIFEWYNSPCLLGPILQAVHSELRQFDVWTIKVALRLYLQVKEMFPQLMDKLSQDKSPGNEELMASAIASWEELNSCLEMAMQVL